VDAGRYITLTVSGWSATNLCTSLTERAAALLAGVAFRPGKDAKPDPEGYYWITLKGNHKVKLKPGDDMGQVFRKYWADLQKTRDAYVKKPGKESGEKDGSGTDDKPKRGDGGSPKDGSGADRKNRKVEVRQKGSRYAAKYLREFDNGLVKSLRVDSLPAGTFGGYSKNTSSIVIDEDYIRSSIPKYVRREMIEEIKRRSPRATAEKIREELENSPDLEKRTEAAVEQAVRFTVVHEMAHAVFATWTEDEVREWADAVADVPSITEYAATYKIKAEKAAAIRERYNAMSKEETQEVADEARSLYEKTISKAKELREAAKDATYDKQRQWLDLADRYEYSAGVYHEHMQAVEKVLKGKPNSDESGKYSIPLRADQERDLTAFSNEMHSELVAYMRVGDSIDKKVNVESVERMKKIYKRLRGRALTASARLADIVRRTNMLLMTQAA